MISIMDFRIKPLWAFNEGGRDFCAQVYKDHANLYVFGWCFTFSWHRMVRL